MLGYSSVTERREQPQSFWLVMPFIKFWVVFMGFFQCSSMSSTGKTATLVDMQKSKNNHICINTGIQKQLSMFPYEEAETIHGTEA